MTGRLTWFLVRPLGVRLVTTVRHYIGCDREVATISTIAITTICEFVFCSFCDGDALESAELIEAGATVLTDGTHLASQYSEAGWYGQFPVGDSALEVVPRDMLRV